MSIGFSVCQTSGEKLCRSAQPKKLTVKRSSPASQSRSASRAGSKRGGVPPDDRGSQQDGGDRADRAPAGVGNDVQAREQPERTAHEQESEWTSEGEPASREPLEKEGRERQARDPDDDEQQPESQSVDHGCPGR